MLLGGHSPLARTLRNAMPILHSLRMCDSSRDRTQTKIMTLSASTDTQGPGTLNKCSLASTRQEFLEKVGASRDVFCVLWRTSHAKQQF